MDLYQLTSKLKEEDKRSKQLFSILKNVLWSILILLTVVLCVSTIAMGWDINSTSTLLLLLAYVILIYVITTFYNKYEKIDYSTSTINMLQQVLRCYRPYSFKLVLVFGALLLIELAIILRLMEINSLVEFDWKAFIQWHTYTLPVWVVITAIGVIKWHTQSKTLYRSAKALIREL